MAKQGNKHKMGKNVACLSSNDALSPNGKNLILFLYFNGSLRLSILTFFSIYVKK